MQIYRYRSPVLVGPWRSSPEEAARDAVKAGQADPVPDAMQGIRWRVPGEIEIRDTSGQGMTVEVRWDLRRPDR